MVLQVVFSYNYSVCRLVRCYVNLSDNDVDVADNEADLSDNDVDMSDNFIVIYISYPCRDTFLPQSFIDKCHHIGRKFVSVTKGVER